MGIKYTFNDASEAQYITEPGEYQVKIKAAFSKLSTRGHDIIVLTCETDDGAIIKDELHFTEAASWRIDVLLKAIKLTDGMEKGHEVEIEPDVFVGKTGTIVTGWDNYKSKDGEEKRIMKIKRWIVPAVDEKKPATKKLSSKADDLKI